MLSDEQIAEIENQLNYVMKNIPNDSYEAVLAVDISSLLADRKEHIADLEKLNKERDLLVYDVDIQKSHNRLLKKENARLKSECVDFAKWHNEVCDGIQSDVDALDKELLAENAALKNAIMKHCKEDGYAACFSCAKECKNVRYCKGRVFDFDRFKEGGDGE